MQRWRESLIRRADLIVTPSARILPAWVPPRRIAEVEWGADTERFRPGATGRVPFERRPGELVAVFAGAFRPWHGAVQLARAVAHLEAQGSRGVHAVFVGDGPELRADAGRGGATRARHVHGRAALRRHARLPRGVRRGRRTVRRRGARAAATGLLLVAAQGVRVHGVGPAGGRASHSRGSRRSVEHGREGLLYDAAPGARQRWPTRCARACDRPAREAMGRAARARVERDFSWHRHCERLDAAMREAVARRHRAMTHARASACCWRPTHSRPCAAAAAGAPTNSRGACGGWATTCWSCSPGPAPRPASRPAPTTGSASWSRLERSHGAVPPQLLQERTALPAPRPQLADLAATARASTSSTDSTC